MLKRKFKNKYTNYRDISFFLKFYILWPNTSSNVRMYYTCKIHRVEPILRARNTKTSVFQAPRTTRNFYTVFESQCRFTNAYDIKMRRTISILRRVHEPYSWTLISCSRRDSRENRHSDRMNLRSVNYPRIPTSLVILSYSHCSYPLHGLALLRTGSMVFTEEKKGKR